MSSETETKPNYSLHYKTEFRDDWMNREYKFNASDDTMARDKALAFIKEHNDRDAQEIKQEKKSWQDWCLYKPLKLERILYVIKEVEERTTISLQGDVASRVRNGSPVELSELANL